MAQASEKPDRLHKAIFLLMNTVNWLGFSVQLVRHWHRMPPGLHFWGIYIAVIFPLLWYVMLREECSLVILVGITLASLGASSALGLCFR